MYPAIILKAEMIQAARALVGSVTVKRTKASPFDTLAGILGEFAFAQYVFGDWQQHRVGRNKGQTDYPGVEIKTSAFPFRPTLNLLIREDYFHKRQPAFYVQIILNIPSTRSQDIQIGTPALLCGYATTTQVSNAPKKNFGAKTDQPGGYECYYVPIAQLQPMSAFRDVYQLYLEPMVRPAN